MKSSEIRCVVCGKEAMVYGMGLNYVDVPFFVSCTGCECITGAWYSTTMAWKEWKLINKPLNTEENEKSVKKDQ